MLSIGNTFLTRREVSTHYVPTSLRRNRTRMLKSLSTLEKMYPDDTNVFAANIIDKYKNRPDNLHSMCLAHFASSYVSRSFCQ